MAKAMGLGRGLDVLLKGMAVDREHPEVMLVKLEDIRPNPRQPRFEFDEESLQDLASSIREQGVLQPVLIRPAQSGAHGYELVAGERRLRASKLAGKETIPALLREVTDEQSLALALIENLQRENLNALEEAKGLDQLLNSFELSQEALAQKVGKSRSAVANSLRLLQLPLPIQESLSKDGITAGHARALLAITDEALREQLWRRVLDRGLSVRETEDQAGYWRVHEALPEDSGAPAKPKAERRQRTRTPAGLAELGGALRDRFRVNVKVGGDEAKGRITFSYNSAEELKALLDAWGVDDAR
ncbi:Chromosome-partitioning protein Spo0J [Fundidesulfovibrio magnetotacticus]|uniref:Chromosome-partitioning protein Spo0J n=1 Tax=Fundidesulfovibrio magnetotacticus TaxID=2730080 RepID=A0A6V8LXQ1_9BACT|nr:ParB/RepB/Spo0J family partition protein [Fundidesulfovibrio magnetotacticus]GFK95361.1 Chromosome-partitioning protein Spo0J [Fundidesulfovibrio magnetotacticus]